MKRKIKLYWLAVSGFVVMLLLAIIFVILSGNNGVGVRARSLTPAPDSTVSTSPEISVLFSRPVDQDSLKNKVLISPTLPIELLWNDNRLRILPRTTLKSDTEYTVTIGPDLRDVHGIELPVLIGCMRIKATGCSHQRPIGASTKRAHH